MSRKCQLPFQHWARLHSQKSPLRSRRMESVPRRGASVCGARVDLACNDASALLGSQMHPSKSVGFLPESMTSAQGQASTKHKKPSIYRERWERAKGKGKGNGGGVEASSWHNQLLLALKLTLGWSVGQWLQAQAPGFQILLYRQPQACAWVSEHDFVSVKWKSVI